MSGEEVFLFDTNNDEDFSEEIAVVGEYFSEGSTLKVSLPVR